MQTFPVAAIAITQLEISQDALAGHSSTTLFGGDAGLRQVVLALVEGEVMQVENDPQNATLFLLSGSVDVTTDDGVISLSAGDLIILPDEPSRITARTDTTALLTVATAP